MPSSYTSNQVGAIARYRELSRLWTFHRSQAETRVADLIALAEACNRSSTETFGMPATGRRILDVGPGEFLIQSRYFALKNDVTAIDLDVIAETLTPRKCVEMFRHNGAHRTAKTAMRKALGIDRLYERVLREKLGVSQLPKVEILRGDVCEMEFPGDSFDMVYSRSVLHHIAEPKEALSEMARVLKPRGVAFVDLHLYSSVNGSLDPRVTFGGGNTDLYWAHLRQDKTAVEGAFLNKLRLSDWNQLFAEYWPGSQLKTTEVTDPGVRSYAAKLLTESAITGYSEQELLITTVTAVWQKQ
jgi:SAM-dependent methyltransferase